MFISKAEKAEIVASIKLLQEQVRDLTAKVVTMGKFPEARKPLANKGRTWTPEQRAQASEQMKKIWMKKKEPRK